MARQKLETRFLTHRFGGGFAPDFGKLVSGYPTETGEVEIPYVLNAQNVFWKLDGGIRKIGGADQLSAELGSGSVIYGLYDYWKIGTSGSPTNRKVCHVSTVIMQDQGSDTYVNLFTGLEAGKHPNYSTFNDLLIIASDSNTDVPKSWDQSTAQNLAGSPPNFAFSTKHRGRQWASGVASAPSRVYYSAANDPEDWSGAGSGFLDIEPGDGDKVTGLASYKNELWVFKGPNKGSIHRIAGATPNDFERILFTTGLGCVAHSTIATYKDDLIFMTPSGSIRSLKATAAFGDYSDAALTFPLNDWLVSNIKYANLYQAWTVVDPTTSRIYIAITTGAGTYNNTILCYDYQFESVQKPNRWSLIYAWPVHSLASYTSNGLHLVMGGGYDGYVRQLNIADRDIDGTTSYTGLVTTPHINYGSSSQEKTIYAIGATVSPVNTDDGLEFDWKRDSVYSGTTVNLNQGDPANDFNEVYADMEDGGQFRWIQYTWKQRQVREDMHMHAFTAAIKLGTHSTESISEIG